MRKENSRSLPLKFSLRKRSDSREIKVSRNPLINRVMRNVEATFKNLEQYTYLAPGDREEFQRYRVSFMDSLDRLGEKVDSGKIRPVDLSRFPDTSTFPDGIINAGMFIGSFDPFQMTHLATALRFLSSPGTDANILFVIPEGAANKSKPALSDYGYRLELINRQLLNIFEPFIVPLDIGKGRDTIGIIDKFIRLFPGTRMTITHVLGSDVLLWAHKLFLDDLTIWRETAREEDVAFSYRLFVIKRGEEASSGEIARDLTKHGIASYMDTNVIGAPSSTDFRDRHALTIIFPSEDILRHMEFAFRYRMNKDWTGWFDLE